MIKERITRGNKYMLIGVGALALTTLVMMASSTEVREKLFNPYKEFRQQIFPSESAVPIYTEPIYRQR